MSSARENNVGKRGKSVGKRERKGRKKGELEREEKGVFMRLPSGREVER